MFLTFDIDIDPRCIIIIINEKINNNNATGVNVNINVKNIYRWHHRLRVQSEVPAAEEMLDCVG